MSDRTSEVDWGDRTQQQIIENLCAQLDQEAKRADQQAKRADQQAKRADQQVKRADQERERANQEAKRADQERERANQEAKRADQQAKRADQAQESEERAQERAQHEFQGREAAEKGKSHALQIAAAAVATAATAVQGELKKRKLSDANTLRECKRANTAEAQLAPLTQVDSYGRNYFEVAVNFPHSTKRGKPTPHTNVGGRRYPIKKLGVLADLEGFGEQLKEQYGTTIDENTCLPDSASKVQGRADIVKEIDPGNERATVRFWEVALEHPLKRTINAVLKNDERKAKYDCKSSITLSDSAKPPADPKNYPGRKGFRPDRVIKRKGSKRCFGVIEYKAAHKFTYAELKTHLANENLFKEVVQEVMREKLRVSKMKRTTAMSTKIRKAAASKMNKKAAASKKKAQHVRTGIAMALTQTYSYMLHYGVGYGVLIVGDSIVLCHVRLLEDPDVLYCELLEPSQHLPDHQTEEVTADQLFYTPLAQVTSFFLLALLAKPLTRRQFLDVMKRTENNLWPELS